MTVLLHPTALASLLSSLLSQAQVASKPSRLTDPMAVEPAIRRICSALGKAYDIKLVYVPKEIPRCTWQIAFRPATKNDLPRLLRYLELFDREFRKYPKGFIKKSRLRTIAFVTGLGIRGQRRAALPDYVKETLYYDFRTLGTYARHVIHHEFFHMLEQEWNGSAYFKDPAWSRLNPPGFRYGKGGARTRTSGVGKLIHPAPGFVNVYAKSGLEEDKAEIWAILFLPSEWRLVQKWKKKDRALAKKVAYLEAFALAKCKDMDAAFWERIRKAKRKR